MNKVYKKICDLEKEFASSHLIITVHFAPSKYIPCPGMTLTWIGEDFKLRTLELKAPPIKRRWMRKHTYDWTAIRTMILVDYNDENI